MRAIYILLLLLCFSSTGAIAQELFPIVRQDGCDSMTPGGECRGYFDFVNQSGHPVTITLCRTTGMSQVHTPPFNDTIFPGDTSRVTVQVNTRGYKGVFFVSIRVFLSDSSLVDQEFRYYGNPEKYNSEGLNPCNCRTSPDYPAGGPEVYADSLVKITRRYIQPDTVGRCEIKLHIPASGMPDSAEVMKSVDPEFETELIKHIAEAGAWIPMCTKSPEPGYPDCRGLKPTGCYLLLTLEISPD